MIVFFYTHGAKNNRLWLASQVLLITAVVYLLIANSDKPQTLPPIHTIVNVNDFINNPGLPYLGLALDLSRISFLDEQPLLYEGSHNTPKASNGCMLARKNTPEANRMTAGYGNRQIVVSDKVPGSESACPDDGVPNDYWGDVLNCAGTNTEWAHFMCESSLHPGVNLQCPTWQMVRETPCVPFIKCCDRHRVLYQERASIVVPYVIHAETYLTMVDEATGVTETDEERTIVLYAVETHTVNSQFSCVWADATQTQILEWACT